MSVPTTDAQMLAAIGWEVVESRHAQMGTIYLFRGQRMIVHPLDVDLLDPDKVKGWMGETPAASARRIRNQVVSFHGAADLILPDPLTSQTL